MNLFSIAAYASWFSPVIPLGLAVSSKRWNPAIMLVTLLCVASLFADSYLLYLAKKGKNNLTTANLYALVRMVLVAAVFFCYWRSVYEKLAIVLFVVAATAFFGYLGGFDGKVTGVTWKTNIAFAVGLSAASIWTLNQLITENSGTELKNQYFFWICAAVLLYFLCTLSIFIFSEVILIKNPGPVKRSFWMIHNIVHIIYNCLLAKAVHVWKTRNLSSTLSPA